jgi:CubicO group peptidase (beta-lactamase class C family)
MMLHSFRQVCLWSCCIGAGTPLTQAQDLYFPPLTGTTWETTDPASLGWCAERIDSLYDFLETRNTKAFIVLKDGRIVLERYFGTFTQDSLWYWASAGKTLTSTLVGIAQQEGSLDIEQPTSTYLGAGWTGAPADKEALITVRSQLTMTSGLDDDVPDDDCTDPACLQYMADAGTRWAYHNAPYTILDQVITNATGQGFNAYFNSRIRNPIGMDGFWLPAGFNNVYVSRARSMARYGLLALNGLEWNGTPILDDPGYFMAATTPSQTLNNSYGYLWWLNGQSSFMVPGVQFVFPGPLMPNAPDDMFSGLGKNDQIVNAVPSRGMVVVRMGNPAYTNDLVPITFNDQIWQHMNWLECNTAVAEAEALPRFRAFPVPCTDRVMIQGAVTGAAMSIFNTLGQEVLSSPYAGGLDVSRLLPGAYTVRWSQGGRSSTVLFVKG